MTALSHVDIRRRRDAGQTLVWRMLNKALQPSSIDVRMGDTIRLYRTDLPPWTVIDPEGPHDGLMLERSIEGTYALGSFGFALAATRELIQVPLDLVGVIVGVSTEARRGLAVEAAGLLDPGYHGHPTLELFNMAPYPYVLRPGARIAQVMFLNLETACEQGYSGRYQGDVGPMSARSEVTV